MPGGSTCTSSTSSRSSASQLQPRTLSLSLVSAVARGRAKPQGGPKKSSSEASLSLSFSLVVPAGRERERESSAWERAALILYLLSYIYVYTLPSQRYSYTAGFSFLKISNPIRAGTSRGDTGFLHMTFRRALDWKLLGNYSSIYRTILYIGASALYTHHGIVVYLHRVSRLS